MPSLKWTPHALGDVQRLHDFLAFKNPEAAFQAIRTIRSGVKILARHPEIGHPAEEMEPDYREWLIPFGQGGYVVLYRLAGDDIILLAIRHAREAGYKPFG